MSKVLVVEDNAANMTLVVFLLESVGHTVLSAMNAEVGLTMARAEKPDLILMDIQLPGMDGLEATGLLKADPTTAQIPVIALTALAMKGDKSEFAWRGATATSRSRFATKPFSSRSLRPWFRSERTHGALGVGG